MELTHGSETSAYYTLTPGKYPKENIQFYYGLFNDMVVDNTTLRRMIP